MKTIYDFRVFEDEIKKRGKWVSGFNPLWLKKQKKEPSVAYKIVFQDDDPNLNDFINFLKKHHKKVLASFSMGRKYSEKELTESELISFSPFRVPKTDDCGEVFDTQYEDIKYCGKECGKLRKQVGPLIFNLSLLNPKHQIIRTIGEEIIVSRFFKNIIEESKLSGCEFGEVIDYNSKIKSDLWYQLFINVSAGRSQPPTKFGFDPFGLSDNEAKKYSCPECNISGPGIVSELYIKKNIWPSTDFARTLDLVGYQEELLNPSPIYLMSPTAFGTLEKNGLLKDLYSEVAHFI